MEEDSFMDLRNNHFTRFNATDIYDLNISNISISVEKQEYPANLGNPIRPDDNSLLDMLNQSYDELPGVIDFEPSGVKDYSFCEDITINHEGLFSENRLYINLGSNIEDHQNINDNLINSKPKENEEEPKNTINNNINIKNEANINLTAKPDQNAVIQKYGLENLINKNTSIPNKNSFSSNSSSTKGSSLNNTNSKYKLNYKKYPFNITHVDEDFLKSNLDKSSIKQFSNINRKRKREIILKEKPDHKIENLEKPILRNFIKYASVHSNDKTISKLIKEDKYFFDELLKKNKGRGGTDFLFVFNDKGKIHKFKSYNQKLMDYIFSKEECYKLYEIYKRDEAFYERYPLKKKGEKGKDVINKFHPNYGKIEDYRQKFNLIYKYHIK